MVVWQAELNKEETEIATDEILDEMCDRLNELWENLKANFLGGVK